MTDLDEEAESSMIHRNFMELTASPSIGNVDIHNATDVYFSFNDNKNNGSNHKDEHRLLQSLEDERSDSEECNLNIQYIPQQTMDLNTKTSSYSIDDALKALQFGKFHYLITFIISIIYFSIGLQAKITNMLYFLIQENKFVFSIPSNAESLLYIAFQSGALFGVYLCALSDKFGRKKIISIACIALSVFSILQIMSYNFIMLVFARLFIGCCCGVAMISSIVLLIEYVPNPTRFRVIYFMFFVGIISYVVGSLIGFIIYTISASNAYSEYINIKHWRMLLIIISVPVWLLPLLNYAYLPQSPHFVALQGKTSNVMDILRTIEHYNEKTSFFNVLHQQSLKVQQFDRIKIESRGKITSLFSFQQYRTSSILLCFISFAIWFTSSTIYGIQYLFMAYLKHGEHHDIDYQHPLKEWSVRSNFAVESIVTSCDIIASLLVLFFLNFMERKKILMFGFAINILLFFIVFIVLILEDYDVFNTFWNFVGISCTFLARTSIDICFYVTQIYILEYYATVLRATSLGFIFYGIGSIALILSFTVTMYVGTSWIMLIFHWFCSVIGFLCARMLKTETMSKPLEDFIKIEHQKNLTSSVHYDYIALDDL